MFYTLVNRRIIMTYSFEILVSIKSHFANIFLYWEKPQKLLFIIFLHLFEILVGFKAVLLNWFNLFSMFFRKFYNHFCIVIFPRTTIRFFMPKPNLWQNFCDREFIIDYDCFEHFMPRKTYLSKFLESHFKLFDKILRN